MSLDEDARRDVRRSVSRRDLTLDHAERGALIDELVNPRLLAAWSSPGEEPTIDIIHETLLRNWSRFRNAIAQQRESLQARERFRLALHEWAEHDRSPDYLLQGVRLAQGNELAQRRNVVIRDAAARLSASASLAEELRQRELEQARALATEQRARFEESRRSTRRLRIWLVAAVAAAAAAVVAAGFAVSAFVRADQQLHINASRELAAQAQAQLATDPELSILLAMEGRPSSIADTQADDALRLSILRSPPEAPCAARALLWAA